MLIGLFAIFIAVIFGSLLKSERFSISFIIIDIAIILSLFGIYNLGLYQIGKDLNDYIMFTHLGSLIFMYLAVKFFWIKPTRVKYLLLKAQNDNEIDLDKYELYLKTSKIRAGYYFGISIILLLITKKRLTIELKEDVLSMNPIFILLGLVLIIVWLILDIYQKKKHGIFLFKTIVPLVVTSWLVIASIILK